MVGKTFARPSQEMSQHMLASRTRERGARSGESSALGSSSHHGSSDQTHAGSVSMSSHSVILKPSAKDTVAGRPKRRASVSGSVGNQPESPSTEWCSFPASQRPSTDQRRSQLRKSQSFQVRSSSGLNNSSHHRGSRRANRSSAHERDTKPQAERIGTVSPSSVLSDVAKNQSVPGRRHSTHGSAGLETQSCHVSRRSSTGHGEPFAARAALPRAEANSSRRQTRSAVTNRRASVDGATSLGARTDRAGNSLSTQSEHIRTDRTSVGRRPARGIVPSRRSSADGAVTTSGRASGSAKHQGGNGKSALKHRETRADANQAPGGAKTKTGRSQSRVRSRRSGLDGTSMHEPRQRPRAIASASSRRHSTGVSVASRQELRQQKTEALESRVIAESKHTTGRSSTKQSVPGGNGHSSGTSSPKRRTKIATESSAVTESPGRRSSLHASGKGHRHRPVGSDQSSSRRSTIGGCDSDRKVKRTKGGRREKHAADGKKEKRKHAERNDLDSSRNRERGVRDSTDRRHGTEPQQQSVEPTVDEEEQQRMEYEKYYGAEEYNYYYGDDSPPDGVSEEPNPTSEPVARKSSMSGIQRRSSIGAGKRYLQSARSAANQRKAKEEAFDSFLGNRFGCEPQPRPRTSRRASIA